MILSIWIWQQIDNYIVVDNHDIIALKKENVIVINSCIDKIYINKNYEPNIEDQTCAPFEFWTIKEIYEQSTSCLKTINMGGRIKNDTEVILGGFEQYKNNLLECNNFWIWFII